MDFFLALFYLILIFGGIPVAAILLTILFHQNFFCPTEPVSELWTTPKQRPKKQEHTIQVNGEYTFKNTSHTHVTIPSINGNTERMKRKIKTEEERRSQQRQNSIAAKNKTLKAQQLEEDKQRQRWRDMEKSRIEIMDKKRIKDKFYMKQQAESDIAAKQKAALIESRQKILNRIVHSAEIYNLLQQQKNHKPFVYLDQSMSINFPPQSEIEIFRRDLCRYIGSIFNLPSFLGIPYKFNWNFSTDDKLVFSYDWKLTYKPTENDHLPFYNPARSIDTYDLWDNEYEYTRTHHVNPHYIASHNHEYYLIPRIHELTVSKYGDINHWEPHLKRIEQSIGHEYRLEYFNERSIVLLRHYPLPSIIPFEKDVLHDREIFFGTNTITGEPYYVPFNKTLHLLVAGASGMGKSVFLNQFLQSLLFNIDLIDAIVMVDLKGGVELAHYAKLHDKIQVTYDYNQLVQLISHLRQLVTERLDQMRQQGKKNHERYVFLIIDEWAQISLHQSTGKAEKETHVRLLADLAALAMLGRAAGLRIVAQLQRPTVDAIPANVRENLTNRVGFRMASRQSAALLFGDTQDLPTDPLKLKRGQFNFYDDSQGKTITLQSSMMDDDHVPVIGNKSLKIAAE